MGQHTANFVLLGHGYFVDFNRVVMVAKNRHSMAMRRMLAQAKEEGRVVSATAGRRVLSVLLLDDGRVVETAANPETLLERAAKGVYRVSKEVARSPERREAEVMWEGGAAEEEVVDPV